MSLLRVAIVGCGFISDSHISAWRNIGADVIAVCDRDISLAKFKAKRRGVARWYGDVFEMVKNERLDAVSICTPANVRLSVIEPIVERGIHVVIEKPFAMSVDEAKKMVELKDRYRVKLTVVHNWLFSHIMKRTLKQLQGGFVGDLASIEISMLHTRDDPMAADSQHWCHRITAGRFGENLPHPLYIIRTILGDVEVRHIEGSKLGDYPWMPIDELRVLLKDRKERMATIYISFNAPRPETTLSIIGNKGYLQANLSNNILIKKRYREIKIAPVILDNLKTMTDVTFSFLCIASAILTGSYRGMHTEFMKKFAHSIINNTDPPVSAEEALKVVELHSKISSLIHIKYFKSTTEEG